MADTSSSPTSEPEPFDDASYVPDPTDHFGSSTNQLSKMGLIGSIVLGAAVILKVLMSGWLSG